MILALPSVRHPSKCSHRFSSRSEAWITRTLSRPTFAIEPLDSTASSAE
jgi:hypothetical protein